jgi:uncharacterized protein (TIGR02145 family)
MILSFESVQKYCASLPPIKKVYRFKHFFSDTFFAKGDKEWRQTSGYYWSSTTNHSNHNNAWVVYFGYGNTNNNNKNNSNAVRCVRSR